MVVGCLGQQRYCAYLRTMRKSQRLFFDLLAEDFFNRGLILFWASSLEMSKPNPRAIFSSVNRPGLRLIPNS